MFRLVLVATLCSGLVVVSRAWADEPASGSSAGSAVTQTTSPAKATVAMATDIERANREDLSTAMGHYSRARSLLLAAIEEFDSGYKLANPKLVLEPKAWRDNVVERAKDLERLLDPQPRISRRGMKYRGDSRLLNEARK